MCKIKTNEECPKCGKIDGELGLSPNGDSPNSLDKEFWGGIDWHYTCSKCGYSEIREEMRVVIKAA